MTVMSPQRRNELAEIESRLVEHVFPPQLVIETTSHCNMRCIHCSHKELERPKAHMDDALFRKIVTEVGATSPDTEVWPTFYGEALILNSRLWDGLDFAAEVGCRNLVLNTNGSLLHRFGHMDRVLRSPLRRFIISLDGFTKETFEAIRVGGSRDVIFASVERLLRIQAERGGVYPVIQCQFSIMEENEHEFEQFKSYWLERGAEVKVRPKLSWTATGSIRAENLDYQTDFRIACPWGNNSAAIHQDGSMVACPCDYAGSFIAGNVREKSVREIWKGPLFAQLRRPHREHRWSDLPEVCQRCPDWQVAGARYIGNEKTAVGSRPFWHEVTAIL